MMSGLTGRAEDCSFVFRLATNPARLSVGVVACAILALAAAASQKSSHREQKPAATARIDAALPWPGVLVSALASSHRETGRIAYETPAPRKVERPASRLRKPASRAARHDGGRLRSFDMARISDILRDVHTDRRQAYPRRQLSLVVTRLDADSVADAEAPTKPVNAPGLPAKSRAAEVQTAFRHLAAGTMDFDSDLGQVTTAARAGTLNGLPAAALDVGLSEGGIRFDAAGMTEMATLSDPAALRKAFKLSTGASIPLD